MTKEEFIKELQKLNIELSSTQLEKLNIYCQELLSYNEHTNLTAINTEEEVYLKHFYDSLTLTICHDFSEVQSVIDIGTGAGFPGLVLKIVYPNINLTLLDSNNKKTKFLEYLTKKLEIDVEIINDRSEHFIENRREYYDIVTARAVKNLPVLTELCLPFVKINGYFLAMKGDSREELEESKDAIQILGGSLEEVKKISLPIEHSTRTIIKIKKIEKTNNQYPRTYEKIIKKPLKKIKK